MTNPTDRTGDVATVAATVIFCRAIAFFYVSRCEMSVAWADLCIANLEFLISCRVVRFSCMGRELFCRAVRFSCMGRELFCRAVRLSCMGRGMSCPGRGMPCHANREYMMVGALTRCSWMAGEWPDNAKEVMVGGEGSWGFRRGSDDRRRGVGDLRRRWQRWVSRGGTWALRTRRKGQKQLLVFAFVPLR